MAHRPSSPALQSLRALPPPPSFGTPPAILLSGMERIGRERRSFPRPPLWLNLLLLIIAAATFAYAKHQRNVVLEKTAALFRNENSPAELHRMRDELAQMDLSKDQLSKELDGRMQL